MATKTFTLSEPVEVEGKTHTEVTMRHFKGRDLMAFRQRAEELRESGADAQFILCEIGSNAPRAVFEEMPITDLAAILEFMKPAFEALTAMVGNAPKNTIPSK